MNELLELEREEDLRVSARNRSLHQAVRAAMQEAAERAALEMRREILSSLHRTALKSESARIDAINAIDASVVARRALEEE